MDAGEDSILIGEALWNGSITLSDWMVINRHLFKDKSVLEVGSGIGLAGIVCSACGAKQVILTDYKEKVMQLIAKNIETFKEQFSKDAEVYHA
jgi:predicted nicotinamide N-methyase